MPLGLPDLPTETYFQYGYLEGIPRLLDLFDRYQIKVSSFMVGQAVERNPQVAREIANRGHECAGHGARWVPQIWHVG
jgi:peptidoglycan/xylan/chitin deacetylase (PgdA/CDA1 family)